MKKIILVIFLFSLLTVSVTGREIKKNWADEIFPLVNELRLRRDCATLIIDAALNEVAQKYVRELAQQGVLSHFGVAGSTLEKRLDDKKIVWKIAGENLARQTFHDFKAIDVVRGWQLSPKHYENIITPAYTHTGIACAIDREFKYIYFVQIFIAK